MANNQYGDNAGGVGDYLLRLLGLNKDNETADTGVLPSWMTHLVSGQRGEKRSNYVGGIRDGAADYYRRFNPPDDNERTDSSPVTANPVVPEGSAGYRSEQAPGNIAGPNTERYDPQMLQPSDQLVKFIADYEELSHTPYKVGGEGNWTIGYGHEILPGENFDGGIVEEQARALLINQVKDKYAPIVREWAVSHNLKLTQQQFDALVSFVYNMGVIDDKEYTPTLSRVIRSGNATPEEVRNAFGLYITDGAKVKPGLPPRRRDEADMYLIGDYKRDEW